MEATEFLGRNVSYMNYILIILKILKDSTSKSQSENPEEEEAFIAMVQYIVSFWTKLYTILIILQKIQAGNNHMPPYKPDMYQINQKSPN